MDFPPSVFLFFGFLQDVESFVREVALGFMPSFLPIAERRGREPFSEKQRQWQLMRRGRYLEFNLLYDRGRLDLPWIDVRGASLYFFVFLARTPIDCLLHALLFFSYYVYFRFGRHER